MRLNHAISITHKIWLLPKSLHICICHKGKRLSSTSSFVVYVVETWEKIRNLLTKKMRKNKFQKVNSLGLFWEIEFSMPNFITQCLRCPKMEKSRLGFNFVIHDYEQNHGQWFLKFRSTYLTSQVIKLFTTSATILQKTYLVSTKSLRKWSTYPT